MYDIPVREVSGGHVGSSSRSDDARLAELEQTMRWVEESRAQLGDRIADLERHQQVRHDAAAVRAALAQGAAFSEAVNDIFDGKRSPVTTARARGQLWQLEQAGQQSSEHGSKQLGSAFERGLFGRRP